MVLRTARLTRKKMNTAGLLSPKTQTSRRKHVDRLTPEAFRRQVWIRDRGRDRVTGQILERVHVDPARRGQVAHLKGRRVRPEWLTDPDRAVLLSDSHHILSDARGNNRLKMTDPQTGEPATDGTKPIRFTLYDKEGRIQWTTVG